MMGIDITLRIERLSMNIALQSEAGAFLGLCGASGSGKTTLLRAIAGLEEARGRIVVDGEVWLDGDRRLPPQKRSVGFVFQEYALFENMRIIDNLLYVQEDRELARHLLEVVELWELRERYPRSLSGGQQQRVALARAFMRRPKLLLLDEPLSALDAAMRLKLQREIARLHKEFGTTTIMVSHDLLELATLCDRIYRLESAKLVEEEPLLRSAALK